MSSPSTANVDIVDVDALDVDTIDVDAVDADSIAVDAVDVDTVVASTTGVDDINPNAGGIDPADVSCHDPFPDVHALFAFYNKKYFSSQLKNVYVEFSTRMTLCAGTCTYRGAAGGCRIALSEPLLKFRPSSDLRSTLLHEMIHAHLFNRGISRDGPDGHGPIFMQFANKINSSEPPSIRVTPYHSFVTEVDYYRIHHWKCERCAMLIKRAMNRPPGPYDAFWKSHVASCGGLFTKIAGHTKPKSTSKRTSARRPNVVALPQNTARGTLSALPPKTVPTHRIEDLLSQEHKESGAKLVCPACNRFVAARSINEHLDTCLTKSTSNNLVTQEPTVRVPAITNLHKSNQSQLQHKLGPPVPRPSSTFRKTNPADSGNSSSFRSNTSLHEQLQQIDSATLSQGVFPCEYETLAFLAFKPQSFSSPQMKRAFAAFSSSQNPSSLKKQKPSFRKLLGPLFAGESPSEREQLAKDITNSLELVLPLGDSFRSGNVGLARSTNSRPMHADLLAREKPHGCPICNEIVPRPQLSSHINMCMEHAGLKKEFCDSDQELPRLSPPRDNATTTATTTEDNSNCPVCDIVISRQSLERHVSQCMTSMGLRDAF